MRDDSLPSPAPLPPALTWRLQSLIFALFFVLAFLSRLPSFFRSVLDWDESLYFLIAAQWRAGHLPYTTIWDNKPVGIYAIFAAAQALFGDRVAAIRLASIAVTALTAFAVYRITRLLACGTPSRAAPLLAGFASILCSLSNDGLAANTEPFMACCTALAVWAAASTSLSRVPRRQAVLTGLLLGAAFMVKYVAVFEAPAVLLLLLLRQGAAPWRHRAGIAALCIAGAALPLLAVIILYGQAGDLPLWWQCSVMANLSRVATTTPPGALHYIFWLELRRWGPLFIAALLLPAAAAWPFRPRPPGFRGAELFLVAWLLGGCLGVAAAKSFYDHYFLQLLPALCVTLGWWAGRVRPHLNRFGFALCAAAFLALPGLAATGALREAAAPVLTWQRGIPILQPDTPTRMAADLNAALAPGPIYVFDSQPILYSLTGQPPPTRYVLPSVLTSRLLARVAGVDARAEVARILSTQPRFIIRSLTPKTDPAIIDTGVYAALNAALAAHYQLWRSYPGAAIYILK
jgi:4-amino-4-deoxy-L-arabinose transferase-like glycosyltransferase